MDESKRVIHSQEKHAGKGIYVFAIFFSFPLVFFASQYFGNGQDKPSVFLALPFLAAVVLLLVLARFQQRKYQRLGATPLTLTPAQCTIGRKAKGTITIAREQFKKIDRLSLACVKYTSDSNHSHYDRVWTTNITPTATFTPDNTVLEFELMIPDGQKPSGKHPLYKGCYHWEIGFEFVEAMENVKRTWKIPVTQDSRI